jgi:hypothetical protein
MSSLSNGGEIPCQRDFRGQSETLRRITLLHVKRTCAEIEVARIQIAETYLRIAQTQELLARSARLRRALDRILVS